MAFATPVPVVPDGSWPIYGKVERFLLDQREVLDVGGHRVSTFKQTAPTYEEIGRLERLAQDLRSDAGHLVQLADDVEELIGECVDAIRNADASEEAAKAVADDA
jgi:hypothetical protein